MQPTTFKKEDDQYAALEFAAAALNFIHGNAGNRFVVETIYFDLGQDWLWTTIVCYNNRIGSYQLPNPKEWEEIVCSTDASEILEIVSNIKVLE